MKQPNFPTDLLDGLRGEEREARKTLIEWALDRGVSVEELREAEREGRLPLVPTELVITQTCRYALDDVAERSGLERDLITRVWRAAGLPVPDPDQPVLSEEDVEAHEMAKQVLDSGLSEEGYLEISRVVGRASAPIAEALTEVTIRNLLQEESREESFAIQLEEFAERIAPLLPALLAFPVRMHIRDAVRRQAFARSGRGIEALAGTRHMAVAFADLVGFTALSEEASLTETSAVASRLEEVATSVASHPVRLVKMIGDAAMLVADDAEKLVHALFSLKQAAEDDEHLPELRIGVAAGEVASRAGDVFGPAVNLASRLAGVAEPGQVLAAPELGDELVHTFSVAPSEPREIKGVGDMRPVEVAARDSGR